MMSFDSVEFSLAPFINGFSMMKDIADNIIPPTVEFIKNNKFGVGCAYGAADWLTGGWVTGKLAPILLGNTGGAFFGSLLGYATSVGYDHFGNNWHLKEETTKKIAEEAAQAVIVGSKHSLPGVFHSLGWTALKHAMPFAVGGLTISYVTINIINYLGSVWRYNIGKPELAQECRMIDSFTSLRDAYNDVYNWWYDITPMEPDIPVFNEEITRKIKDIQDAIPELVKNNRPLQNVLFFGPGGTGKTMISKMIAKNAGFSYIGMSGGDIAKYIMRGEHVTVLNEVFARANKSSVPTVIFIDEVDALARERGASTAQTMLELQEAFLSHTGSPSNKVMIIGSTNHRELLEKTFDGRMDYKIQINPPGVKERATMIKNYLPRFFQAPDIARFFTNKDIEQLAVKIEGFTGRDITKMLNAIGIKKGLTGPIIAMMVNDFVNQRQSVAKKK